MVNFSIYLNRRVFIMNVQADLNLCWEHMSEDTYSDATTHM